MIAAAILVIVAAPKLRSSTAAGEATSAAERGEAASGGATAPKGGLEWPRYRGPNGDAVAEDAGIPHADLAAGFRKVWSVPLPDEPSADTGPSYARYNTYSGPVVAGGKVYAPSKVGNNDVLSCFDAATGNRIWRYEFEVPVLKKEYGTGMRAAPCVHGDYIYMLSYWGHLSCLDRKDGNLAWRRDLVGEYNGKLPPFGASASPVVLDGRLIVLPGGPGAAVAALDPATGKELWRSGDGEPAYATPTAATICGVRQILAFIAPGLVAFDAATGRELWRYDYPEDWRKNIAAPIIVGDIVYIANRTLGVTALRISFDGSTWNVSKLWASRKEKMHFASPVLGDGCMFYHDGKKSIRCLDLSSGSLLWAEPDLGSQWAGMIRIGRSHLLAATDDGHLNILEVSRESCRRIVRFQAFGVAFVQPAIADGRLYVQDFKELACFDLRDIADKGGGRPEDYLKPIEKQPGGRKDIASIWESSNRSFQCGWLAALALSLLGVVLVSRGRGLSSLAVCQAAALGTALAMLAAGIFAGSGVELLKRPKFYTGMAIILATIASLALRIGSAGRASDLRRATVWIALAAAAIGLAAISRVQISTVDVWALVSSDAIRAEKAAVGDLTAAAAAAAFAVLLATVRFAPSDSSASGFWWRGALLSICAGVAIGYSVRLMGAFFSTAMLLAPPLMAVRLLGGRPGAFVAAPAAGLAAVSIGMLLAFKHNLSPGRASAVIACLLAGGAWGMSSAAGAILARIFPTPEGAGHGSADRTGSGAPAGLPAAATARRFQAATLGASACASLGLMAWIARPYFEGFDILPAGRLPIASYRPVFVEGSEAQWPSFRGPRCAGLAPPGKWPIAWSAKGDGRESSGSSGSDGSAGEGKAGGRRDGILWKTEVPLPGYSSPIVWGKRVFCTGAGDESRELFCFDADDGRLLWRRAVGPAGKIGGDEPQSGWAAPTPASDGKRVLAVFPTGFAAAFDFEGNEIWSKNLGRLESRYGYSSSPTVWKDRFILQLDIGGDGGSRPRLTALDAATGRILWERDRREGESWSSPAMVRTERGDLIVTCAAPRVIAYRPEDGSEVWRASVLGGDVVPSAVFAGGMALVCNDQARLAAVRLNGAGDVTGSGVAWTHESHDLPDTASPVTDGEYVYLFSAGGVASCWDVASGNVIWSHQFDTGFCASPILTEDGIIYAWDTAGACHLIRRGRKFAKIRTNELGEGVRASPAFAGGRIYVRGERRLFCIGEK